MIKMFYAFAFAAMLSLTQPVLAKQNDLQTSNFETNLHCENCAKKIMSRLPYQKGVKDVKVDVPSKVVSVSYDPNKLNDEQIVTVLKKLDFDAKKTKNFISVKPCCSNGCGKTAK